MPKTFKPSLSAETQFGRQLRKIARASAHIVGVHIDGTKIIDETAMLKAIRDYSKLIGPWAERQAAKMILEVSRSNKRAYNAKSKTIGKLLNQNVAEGSTGQVALKLMQEQVGLIKSIPLKAAERAQKLAMEAVYNGDRAASIADELREGRTKTVSESDAMRIARTEVARSSAYINQARAQAVGSNQYRWRNSGDAAVRAAHKYYHGQKIDGRVFDWNSPPTLDDGTTGHPGTFPNCRCYAEPVFDSE